MLYLGLLARKAKAQASPRAGFGVVRDMKTINAPKRCPAEGA